MSSPVGLGAPRDPLVSVAGLLSLATAPGHHLNGDSLWRLFYLIIPLILSLPVILVFERAQLRKAIAQTALPLPDGQMLRFTVSIGVCSLAARDLSVKQLFKVADQALYAAKRGGRNRVEIPSDGN